MTLIKREDAIEAVNMLDIFPPTKDAVARELMALPSAETHEIRTETHDLISRERTLRAINGYLESIPYIRNTLADMGRRDATMHCLYIISELPSADAEWIPCSERLPSEKDGQVLVTKHGEVRIATYSEFSGTWYVGEMCAVGGEDPIAWMPLPKPYREGGEA